jgi:hypothetical protein
VSFVWSEPVTFEAHQSRIGVDYEQRAVYLRLDLDQGSGWRSLEVQKLEQDGRWKSLWKDEMMSDDPDLQDPTPAMVTLDQILADVQAFILSRTL